MRRLQIYLDDELAREAARRRTSNGALVRQAVVRDLGPAAESASDPWVALDGWLSDGGVYDVDALMYEP